MNTVCREVHLSGMNYVSIKPIMSHYDVFEILQKPCITSLISGVTLPF